MFRGSSYLNSSFREDVMGDSSKTKKELILELEALRKLVAPLRSSGTSRGSAERKQHGLQLQQARKMDAIGVLAAGVAHDFNNILTTIGLNSEAAMDEVGSGHPGYMCMDEVLKASRAASELTRQLLLFSRKETLHFVADDLNRTVADMLGKLACLTGEGIQIETELDAVLKPVCIDRGSIEQALVNLSVNAGEVMKTGGRLTIKTSNVKIKAKECKSRFDARPGDFVRLSVSDTGAGMDSEVTAHIFEPFFTSRGAGKGPGLALSVVYGIAKQHDGWVEVESAPGKGTEFSLYIPVEREAAAAREIEAREEELLRVDGLMALLIEDEPNVRAGVSKILQRRGFIVLEADSAQEARSLFDSQKKNIHFVISDVMLPDGTGLELVEEFLGVSPELKILLSSGYMDEKSQRPLIKEHKYRFIQKPYSVGELLDAVKESLKEPAKQIS